MATSPIKPFSAPSAALIALRHHLHQCPELSGQERATAQHLRAWLRQTEPDEVIHGIGGHSFAVCYHGNEPGPRVLVRAELDALPIVETNDFAHASREHGVSHKCGHDGHAVILCALAQRLERNRPKRGSVVLLFQEAEETGEGAIAVTAHEKFRKIAPDYAFALHNIPGFPLGEVHVKPGAFNCASRGLIVRLKGLTAHAAEPENGNSPAMAMCTLVQGLQALNGAAAPIRMATVVHAQLGEVAFGTAPGEAVVMATLRTESDEAMQELVDAAEQLALDVAVANGLSHEVAYQDIFMASHNHEVGAQIVTEAACSLNLPVVSMESPFRWSEDFGCISRGCKGVMFGLGAGEDTPALHNPAYDFPDALIPLAADIFLGCIERALEEGL